MTLSGPQFRVMSEELGDIGEPDNGLMEGLLFDLGILGDYPAALGGPGPRSRSGLPVERTLSSGPPTFPACGAPMSVSTALGQSFDYDPDREVAEKSAQHVPGESLFFIFVHIRRHNLMGYGSTHSPTFWRRGTQGFISKLTCGVSHRRGVGETRGLKG